jgi:hypothetical protein
VDWADDDAPSAPIDGVHAHFGETDGGLLARVVVARFTSDDREPQRERLDLLLQPDGVRLRRTALSGTGSALSDAALGAEWTHTPPDHRDASVLFVQVLGAVVDAYADVLDEIRRRVGIVEERMLTRSPPLSSVMTELLHLSRHLATVRDGLLSLRREMRQLAELRAPVERGLLSPAGGQWLATLQMELTHEVPSALATAESRIEGALMQVQGERSEATNRVVLLLTLVTAVFVVPTLLTGLYGMNVPLPFARDSGVFWVVLGVAGALVSIAAVAITRLGLWRTFRTVVPTRRRTHPDQSSPG